VLSGDCVSVALRPTTPAQLRASVQQYLLAIEQLLACLSRELQCRAHDDGVDWASSWLRLPVVWLDQVSRPNGTVYGRCPADAVTVENRTRLPARTKSL